MVAVELGKVPAGNQTNDEMVRVVLKGFRRLLLLCVCVGLKTGAGLV